ncbi:MAG: hypothetical protein ACYC2K_11515 [Gemmatimonadales bacterium]
MRLGTWLATVAVVVGASPLAGQARRAQPSDRCRLQIVNVDREGVRTTPMAGTENYFAGGNVHARCAGRNIHMYADSVASYGGSVVQFISLGSKVRYRDSTTALDADFGTYFQNGERFEAQNNVTHRDLESGSTITGQRIDYLRPVRGLRTEMEVIAYNRPTVSYLVKDSAGQVLPPYTIIGNTVRTRANEVIYAQGNVTIDREDLKGAADSLWLDTGRRQAGQLVGRASLRSDRRVGFTLSGRVIDIGLAQRELRLLKARDSAKLISKDITLAGDSVGVELINRQPERILAWGKTVRPSLVSSDYLVRGDSLRVEMPNQRLTSLRAFGGGWVGFSGDTASAGSRRDWISGDTVAVAFLSLGAGASEQTKIREVEAIQNARSYYQLAPERGQTKGSINYTRAKRILVTMRITPDSNTVQQVDAVGEVDGIHLQPALTRARDTTAAGRDSTIVLPLVRPDSVPQPPRRDTTGVQPRRGNP